MNNDCRILFETYRAKSITKEALDPVGAEDKDVNNDGKVDATDGVIMAKRNKIEQSIARGKEEAEEQAKQEQNNIYQDALFIWDFLLHKKKYAPQDALKIIGLAKASFEHMI